MSRYTKPLKRELAKFLPSDEGPLAGAVFECAFQADGDLDSFEDALSTMPEITWSRAKKGRAECLLGRPKGAQMSFEIYASKKGWRLDVRFRNGGRNWGSNEAYYNRFRAEALPLLDAYDEKHLRPTFRRKV